MDNAYSVNGVPIRLSYERWYHIVENHDEMASRFYDVLDTIECPDMVLQGHRGSLKACSNLGRRRWMVVIYRELSGLDGFIITAYLLNAKPKGTIVWRQ